MTRRGTMGTIRKCGAFYSGFLDPPYSIHFTLFPCFAQRSLSAPHFQIFSGNRPGMTRIGAAWLKTMKRHGRDGERFLSITFDGACFGKSLNVAAFKDAAPDHWNI